MTDQSAAQTLSSGSKRPSFAGWLMWSFMILVTYVLSIGPAYRLQQARLITASATHTIYAPIEHIVAVYQPAFRLYLWYLGVWGVHIIFE
jgi:hypothetical protein